MSNSSFGPANKKETIYSGPPVQGTVYDPNWRVGTRPSTPNPNTPKKIADEAETRRYGNVFFVIALLSFFNTIGAMTGSLTAHAIGLGIGQVIDGGIRRGAVGPVFVINGVIWSFFCALGFFARKGSTTAYILGIVLYGADTVFLLSVGTSQLLAWIFHALMLGGMFMGLSAVRKQA
ncbi:MAG TPA: hypothetical protein VKZ53_18870 [Candidatus Angelobacter sp.]|nr:hypothetical protein [Candidatus Angelobacter sp.]